jgi:hypothetical protein
VVCGSRGGLDGLLSMTIGFTTAGLRQASWRDYLARFLFGGALTALTGAIAQRYGPTVGGLFLAFPAILPASLTLLARHQRERKARHGLNGTARGGLAAALDARGASLGSAGLLVFALVVWQRLPRSHPVIALMTATGGWAATAYLMWRWRKT